MITLYYCLVLYCIVLLHLPLPSEREPPPLKSEVAWAMGRTANDKSPGSDGVPVELFKEAGESGINMMHKICTDVWNTGKWPTEWMESIFITIPKKGDRKECTNHRTIALVSHASKILLKIILGRIHQKIETEISDEQAGFRPGRGTRDQIINLRILMQKAKEHRIPLYMCFVDFHKAFDCIKHEKLWVTMLEMGFPAHLVDLVGKLYRGQKAAVRVAGVLSDWFSISKGVRQGCVLSPYLFNIIAEMTMREALENFSGGFKIGGRMVNNLRYADDIVIITTTPTELQALLNRIRIAGMKYGLVMMTISLKRAFDSYQKQ